ncbi:MAG: aminotransferase class V-fold PLP-dependent enzyme [Gemmataceae bacterium]|nr:aminotransferase class V-fold PLP-dependent enzyme [Gemmataceae bacterium]MCI0741287.1 aminotransferase class V-fold PLP-dependent enzyme [Gemmataceae bacterium]
MHEKWRAARAAMLLDPEVANLNTGSFGPLPRLVFERVTTLRRKLAEEPMDFLLRALPPLLWEARVRLATFVGADVQRLFYTANVTAAVNIVASGLRLSSPGEILLTDHEYGAMHWCWERAAQRQGLTLRTFALPVLAEDPAEIVASVENAFSDNTRLLFFSHVLSPTGLVLPAHAICAAARRRGILTVVDGAHAPAMTPLDLEGINADFYGANCHKWLLAPTGAGFLHLGKGNEDRLQPHMVSWGFRPERGSMDQPDEFGSTPRLRYYEFEGTRDCCPWLAVPAAIDFQSALGWDEIKRRNEELVLYTRQALGERCGLPLHTPKAQALHGYITAFRLPAGTDAPIWRQTLWERYCVEAPIVERPDGLLLRVSTHFYNTTEEIDRLAQAVSFLLA